MRISRASTYALYGLSHLAREKNGRRVPLSEIRRNHGVPEKHLAKLFLLLVRAGVLKSSRGVNGGFSLARDPSRVTLLEIIEIIDGPVREGGCMLSQMPCVDVNDCGLSAMWQRAQGAMLDVLGSATLADVSGAVPVRRRPRADKPRKRG